MKACCCGARAWIRHSRCRGIKFTLAIRAKRTVRPNSAKMTDTVEKVSAKKLWNWNLKRWSASGSLELENSDGRARNEIRLRHLHVGYQPLATKYFEYARSLNAQKV